jgi:hypothetical protein
MSVAADWRARLAAAGIALPCVLLAAGARADTSTHQLDNGVIRAVATEEIGGRLLSFSLASKPNFLKLDERAGDPAQAIDARTENIGYLGHEIWLGPQSHWWAQQNVNPERAAKKAVWPPDPYLSLAKYTVAKKTALELIVDSPASPVSGISLSKRYALVPGKANSLQVEVSATNRRDRKVAWDIWFNTRTHGDTRVYVPLEDGTQVRTQAIGDDAAAPLRYSVAERIFSLDIVAPPPGQSARSGKIFLQPAYGWMAGFRGEQAFIVQFALQARTAIHPEQGQIELFSDYRPAAMENSLLEMEVHAPYVALEPGKTMKAAELWTIVPYQGLATRAAHIAFLRKQAKQLGLQGLDLPAR